MDEKALFRATSWLEQPPPWADPDYVSEEMAAANAAAWNAAASNRMNGVRSTL